MYFQAGNFVHGSNLVDVSFSIRHNRNARGFTGTVTYLLELRGTLIPTATQAAIRTAIDDLLLAYDRGSSIGDCGLYHDDGTASSYYLRASSALGGVLIQEINFPFDGGRGMYATAVDFRLTLRAIYPNTGVVYQDFREEIQVTGTGGPRKILVESLTGVPQEQILTQRTPVTARQSGFAVGLSTYPPYPTPIWPRVEQVERRQQNKGAPTNNAGVFTDYPISWTYQFLSPSPLGGTPHRV